MAKITVQDSSGSKVAQFTSNNDDSIGVQAQVNGAEIPFACGGAGACGVCKCKVKKGAEHIEKDKFGDAIAPIEADEVLSCVAGIKDNAPEDAEIQIESENL
ncbi:MAG: 2Fe-2S iron-sulfur cluster-binding protein [Candidatus Peregrinibacteria bacterium]|nr:2Fe-2S iron-sulfur cluster-binding protein [Candidatus Peregrinibacteria bacterium]